MLKKDKKWLEVFISNSGIHNSWTILDTYEASPPVGDEDGFQAYVLQKMSKVNK